MIDNRENNIWTVYVHIVPKTITEYDYDKYYVGITSKSVEKRWVKGLGYQGQIFYDVIQKYGWDNIEHYIIAEHLTQNEAESLEIKLIDKLKTNVFKNKYGYNCTDGGGTTIGYKFSDERKKEMSLTRKGQLNGFYGKKHTEETKLKMKQNHLNFKGGNHPQAKKIYKFDKNGNYIKTYNCIREAAREINTNNGGYIAECAKKQKLGYGYLWGRNEDIIIINNIPQLNYKYNPINNDHHSKHIYMFDLNKRFIKDYNSCAKAALENKLDPSGIIKIAKKKRKSLGGYIWRYKEDIGFNENNEPYFIE